MTIVKTVESGEPIRAVKYENPRVHVFVALLDYCITEKVASDSVLTLLDEKDFKRVMTAIHSVKFNLPHTDDLLTQMFSLASLVDYLVPVVTEKTSAVPKITVFTDVNDLTARFEQDKLLQICTCYVELCSQDRPIVIKAQDEVISDEMVTLYEAMASNTGILNILFSSVEDSNKIKQIVNSEYYSYSEFLELLSFAPESLIGDLLSFSKRAQLALLWESKFVRVADYHGEHFKKLVDKLLGKE